MTDTEKLAERLLQWEERWEHGEDVSASELCPDCPELMDQLQHQIDILKKMAWMKGDSDDSDSDTKQRPDPLLSKTLGGRYRIDAFLAEGGFGRVYRGYDPELDRPVAVKVAKATAVTSPDLLQEARRVAKLRHPGIVPIHDVGHDEGIWFFVSDLMDGQTLADLSQKPTPAEAGHLVAQVADALHYAHEQGFIHRDIKPSNILLDNQGRPQITDFGIAVTTEEITDRRLPRSGTLPYMAPEQVAGEVQLIGARTDVYALGVVFYELLTGSLPYEARTPTVLKEQILFRSPRPPGTLNPQIPALLEQICLRCLAKHPADRFTDARELVAALRNGVQEASRSRRKRSLNIAVAACTTVLVGVLLWSWLPPRTGTIDSDGENRQMTQQTVEANNARDREVATHILQMGGEIEILDRDGRRRLFEVASIPSTPFYLTEVKCLANMEFGDDDLKLLVGLPRLESIYVAATNITDDGMRYVGSIPTLQNLGMGASKVSDNGIAELTRLKKLYFLALNNTQVTDGVFQHLFQIENLRNLDLRLSRLSPESVDEFRRQRPLCLVRSNEGQNNQP